MYLGADAPAAKTPASTTPGWVGAVEPVGNVVTGIVGALFGKTPQPAPTAPTQGSSNMPLLIGGGIALLAGGVIIVSMTNKKKGRRRR
jgi:hypothetical protein